MGLLQIVFLIFISANLIFLGPCQADETMPLLNETDKQKIASFEGELYKCMAYAWIYEHNLSSDDIKKSLAARVSFTVNQKGKIEADSFNVTSSNNHRAAEKAFKTKDRLMRRCHKLTFPSALKQDYKATFRLIRATDNKELKKWQNCKEFDSCEPLQATSTFKDLTGKENTENIIKGINYQPFMNRIQTCVKDNLSAAKISTDKEAIINISWKLDREGLIVPNSLNKKDLSDDNLYEAVAKVVQSSQKCFGKPPLGAPETILVQFKFTLGSEKRTNYNKGLFEINYLLK